ncbi:MAG TPA: lipid droplet-associated protein, partial [Pseudonocardiaceae bacterium]|nr:lipid droplet-associated protein [Pseudonocardiaceae bacterium]
MSHVPLPVRVAVGLMVTAVEQARKLPEQLADLPVTAASRAVQAGMRVQQRVTELAIKGDQVFSLLNPVEDTPPWARFDEDDEPEPDLATRTTQPDSTDNADNADNKVVMGGEVDEADAAQALTPPKSDGVRSTAASGPSELLARYDEMSLAQLRTMLRKLSLPQLEVLLAHEHAHRDRPAFVTLLSNRISTV